MGRGEVYLVMVTPNNNNKFYKMQLVGNEFKITYGRIEQSCIDGGTKPMSKWNSIYNSKIRKGYVDQTELMKSTNNTNVIQIENSFLRLMSQYRDDMLDRTYSINMKSVTQDQIEKARSVIQELKFENDTTAINNKLCELYSIIPRRMKNVRDHQKIIKLYWF